MHALNRLTRLSLAIAAAVALQVLDPAAAATYEVGPGKPLVSPDAVPWESLQAGDTVLIHWRASPYLSKWVVCRQGTANAPITIRGVPGPAGQLPIIDGNNATTRSVLNYWGRERSVLKIGGASVPADATPRYIVVENLDIRSGRPPFSFTRPDGAAQSYVANAASIYVEKGEHITIRNCILRDSGNGLFVSYESKDLLIEGNHIYDNGNDGSIYEHNSYTAAVGITFQYNRYGPPRTNCLGNNLKDRSAGLVVRHNWIEGGNRQLDLVDGEDSPVIHTNALYHATHVYGNVLIEPDGAGNRQMVHYGGDGSDPAAYRKGTLYFYNNTLISTRTDRTTIFRLSTNDEFCDCRNNLIYVSAAGSTLSWLDASGRLFLSHNGSKPGYVTSFGTFSGYLTNDNSGITFAAPGFLDTANQNFRLATNSTCLNAGTNVHPAVLPDHAVLRQYVKHRSGEPRRSDAMLDIGAYEFSPYEAWRHAQFGLDVDTASVSSDGADPDGDEVVNLLEYAFNLDPRIVSRNGIPIAVTTMDAGHRHLGIRFTRRLPLSELFYTVQVSDDLGGWTNGSTYSDAGAVPDTALTMEVIAGPPTTVRLKAPMDTVDRRFLRIRVRREGY